MANNNSSMVKSIDRVITSARDKYDEIMTSDYVAKDIRIDGTNTRGQIEENKRKTNTKEEYTRTVTCKLDAKVKRGSLIEIKRDDEDIYDAGVVTTPPMKTPVDYYFQCLLFNTTAIRTRKQFVYSEDGYVIGDSSDIRDEIPLFVQRVGMRERQVDVGIDRNAVNEFITVRKWDIQKNDILQIGSDRYKITDIKELDKELFWGYMTYYRE